MFMIQFKLAAKIDCIKSKHPLDLLTWSDRVTDKTIERFNLDASRFPVVTSLLERDQILFKPVMSGQQTPNLGSPIKSIAQGLELVLVVKR